jgi:beta-glucosidase
MSSSAAMALDGYVASIYQDLLHRPVDAAGQAYWVDRIDQGAPLDRVAAAFVHGGEHFSALIESTYQSALGRAPGPQELNYWVAAFQGGMSDEQFEASVFSSDEFRQRAGASDAAFIDGIYQSLFGRSADPSAQAFWNEQLATGASWSVVAEQLTHSVEREQRRVEDDYADVLHAPGDPEGIAYWTEQLIAGLSNEDLLTQFASSHAYFERQTGQPIATVPLASDFGSWQSDVAAIDARVGQSRPDLLFVGDSITANWNAAEGAGVWTGVYAARNAAQAGVFGDETQGLLWRLEHTALANLNPKLVVLLIGTNNLTEGDSPADVAAGIQAVVQTLRQNYPNAKILLMGVLPRGASADDPLREAAAATNQLIVGLADGQHVDYVDLWPSLLYPDGAVQPGVMLPGLIHLDTIGYQKWAAAIEPLVRATIG